jgi:hypothetical protein
MSLFIPNTDLTTFALTQETVELALPEKSPARGNGVSLSWPVPVFLGLLLTLFQVGLAWGLSYSMSPRFAYARLSCWDSGWYEGIVTDGYISTANPTPEFFGNVAFFPAYPFWSRWVGQVFHLAPKYALPLAAQIACFGFWSYFLLILQRWHISRRLTILAVLLLLTHPAAFFLVAGYSESLFLFSLLGFIYWTDHSRWYGQILAALHGALMTATRLVGVPVAAYPTARVWLSGSAGDARAYRRYMAPLLVAGSACLGCIAFFAYCQWHFGQWNLYMKTEEIGWGVHADYFAIFKWKLWRPHFPRWLDGFFDPDWVSHASVYVLTAVFCLLYRLERRAGDGGKWPVRAPLYLCAAMMFYINIAGRSNVWMSSMVRYALCIEVLLVLGLAHYLARAGLPEGYVKRHAATIATVWMFVSLAFQIVFTWRFAMSLWVA